MKNLHWRKLPGALGLAATTIVPMAMAQQTAPTLDLTATGWELVEVLSMDDSRFAPKANQAGGYALLFEEGKVVVEADCNRGTMNVEPLLPPRLKFSDIDVTRDRCAAPSVAGRFLDQLPWIRSYVTREGHLFLATAADGSILEFRPLSGKAVSARVLGFSLVSNEVDTVRSVVLARLMDDYARRNGLQPTEEEVARLLHNMAAARAGDINEEQGLSAREKSQLDMLRRDMAQRMIRAWKVNAALHEEYGGRIIYQQLGPEPIDAYVDLLRAQEDSGEFALLQNDMTAPFWDYFTDDNRHDFLAAESEDAKRAFSVPPWEKAQ